MEMPRTLRAVNVVAALAALASGLAVLVSVVAVPEYPYRDPLAIVVAYCAFYAWVAHAFWRGTPAAPRLALAKALGAYAFLLLFVVAPDLGLQWMSATPGRYVYQVFDWGPEAGAILFAFVFLGRGAWNTVNAFTCSRDWWFDVRARRPLLGRVLTAIPVAITVGCVWEFMALVRIAKSTSLEASEIAHVVEQSLSCDDIRAKAGTVTSDLRQRGDRQYRVLIKWNGCADTRIVVRDPDDRMGVAVSVRPDCCSSQAPGGAPETAPAPTAPAAPAA